MTRKVLAAVAVSASIILLGCSGDKGNNSPQTTNNGQPTENPQGTPAPAPLRAWNSVSNQSFTDMVAPNTCDMPFRFRVNEDGTYRAGPCTTGGTDFKAGTLTLAERAEVDSRAKAVAAFDLSQRYCSAGSTVVGSFTRETFRDGTSFEVLRNMPDQYCFDGNESVSKNLHQYVLKLSKKYYPQKP